MIDPVNSPDHEQVPSAATIRALTRRLATEQRDGRVPSVVAGLVRDETTVWTGSRGRVNDATPTPHTQYRIGSITKTFIAVLVLRLRDEGLLQLSDPVEKHLPGTTFGDRTVAALLAHAGGLTAEPPGPWWERTQGTSWSELADRFSAETTPHRAGRRHHYSNLGFAALGEIVARIRGEDWLAALDREILVPLELTRTTAMPVAPHAQGWAVHPWADVLLPEPAHDGGAMGPAGQLWSTVTDMLRWSTFLGGDTAEVLHPDTLAEMSDPVVVEDGDGWRSGQGLGLQLLRHQGRRLVGHGGSMPGFLSTVWADRTEKSGVVFLANATSGIGGALAIGLLDILVEQEPRVPAEWRPQATQPDPELLALTGEWYWGTAAYVLRLLPDGMLNLTPMGGRGRTSRFRAVDDGWIGLDGYYAGEHLRVVRRSDGTVSHLDLNTFIFARTPYDPTAPIPGDVDPGGWRGSATY
ncbi:MULTISPECIES: serine hydrolase domain-containing protein [Actinoalloteichus]|uniref:Penicillin-binding protein, beta-lactamase class C n=1 Tax=Actinoalloteichus fjordicus TaxID=1612552 RepID=A0AAC9LHI8_9PSEU|nr:MULTISPECIES: serine hydrolase domain-containing protein [Actinoalloteichus]APU17893.1 penicillin-binding protein, beta-lactamase class C [Actinoalloteichus fjordicus]APU23971.1 penicillin-binding protein, beta-lactamase class C [Actinoalloteichus sp. GBA129-24]